MKEGPLESLRSSLTHLEYLRFLLAVCVVIYHSQDYGLSKVPYIGDSGFFAVLSFMVLSGIVLSFSAQNRPTTVVTFIRRRFIRLYPLHFFTAITMLIFGTTFVVLGERPDIEHFFLHMTLLHGTGLESVGILNTPSWAVSTEFVVAIILSFVIVRDCDPVIRVLIMALCLLLHSFEFMDTRIIICIFAISAGTLIFKFLEACHLASNETLQRTVVTISSLVLLCLVLFRLASNRVKSASFPAVMFLKESYFVDVILISAGLISFLLTLHILRIRSGKVSQLGRYAYSVYLFHVPAFTLAAALIEDRESLSEEVGFFLVSVSVLFVFSVLGHRYLEYPTRWLSLHKDFKMHRDSPKSI